MIALLLRGKGVPPLNEDNVKNLLEQVVNGNSDARESLIEHYRPFILKEASRVTRRFLEWGKDEELSVAILAFNEAIDAYCCNKGRFEPLARVVIRRRLIDFFRKSKSTVPTGELTENVSVEEDWEQGEREQEVIRYQNVLRFFNLDLMSVAGAQPTHMITRKDLQAVAMALASRTDLMHQLFRTGKLPKNELCRLTGKSGRVLERGRVYVIALAILLAGDEFPYLKGFVENIIGKGGES